MGRNVDEMFGLGNKPSKRDRSDESEEFRAPDGKKRKDIPFSTGEKKNKY